MRNLLSSWKCLSCHQKPWKLVNEIFKIQSNTICIFFYSLWFGFYFWFTGVLEWKWIFNYRFIVRIIKSKNVVFLMVFPDLCQYVFFVKLHFIIYTYWFIHKRCWFFFTFIVLFDVYRTIVHRVYIESCINFTPQMVFSSITPPVDIRILDIIEQDYGGWGHPVIWQKVF